MGFVKETWPRFLPLYILLRFSGPPSLAPLLLLRMRRSGLDIDFILRSICISPINLMVTREFLILFCLISLFIDFLRGFLPPWFRIFLGPPGLYQGLWFDFLKVDDKEKASGREFCYRMMAVLIFLVAIFTFWGLNNPLPSHVLSLHDCLSHRSSLPVQHLWVQNLVLNIDYLLGSEDIGVHSMGALVDEVGISSLAGFQTKKLLSRPRQTGIGTWWRNFSGVPSQVIWLFRSNFDRSLLFLDPLFGILWWWPLLPNQILLNQIDDQIYFLLHLTLLISTNSMSLILWNQHLFGIHLLMRSNLGNISRDLDHLNSAIIQLPLFDNPIL